ncbi:unnamed protein product [Bemisia tabaci]|uniref:Ketoreductase domain-containing protein n=1 Tax=Bemisia tabaci TaxID=7038 RepID=A0A9P0ADP8_BEMTA|nr:PREDICTED: uncharacterized protein LOC109031729 [Bemisia tabaci]XP_018898974.1 PREDICTED: uncharacterized protein LOC109031729 [Bemisia tabaci]XP_018898975.1 PREDICTED: uncharacterized protein LOC109031729 [Bemisia tabaci]CAH0389574.1 unnamed protein product [Bemisia tabaci]
MAFRGKVVLVTGASSGIGAATAKLFAKLGASLALTGRNLSNLEKVAAECKKVGEEVPFLFKADLNNETETKNLLESVLTHFKHLDVLVNNAGILEGGTIENTSLEQYDRIFNTNVRSVYHLTMLAVPHLITSKGSIVNVSSVNGLRSYAGVLAYNMSKSALDQFTRCVALELAPKGVRVNSVNPGVIITEIHKRGGMDDAAYAKFLERSKETHPLGRPGSSEEVAKAIIFLASEDASFSTGVNLPVDGGRHAFGFR